jgi:hypothetical protein
MILSSESKLCVTLVLILALLAVLNMNSAKPVANVGAVTQSSSSVISNFTTNSSSKGKLTKKSSKSTKSTKTTTTTSTTPKKVAAKKVAAKKVAAKKVAKKAAKPIKKGAAKKVAAKVAKVVKKAAKETKKKKFKASDYLPKEVNKKWWNTDFSVAKNKVNNKNLIPTQNYITGVNTVASSLRLANHDLRARPANPQIVVSPWLNTTVAPDHNTKPLGI